MKKLLSVVLSIALTAPAALAATEDFAEGMGKKAIRGAINLVTGVVEVPMQVYKST